MEKSDDTKEVAKLGYETAVQLWIYEGELIWSKYNAMLVANSIVMGILGFAISSSNVSVPKYYMIGLSVVGIVLGLVSTDEERLRHYDLLGFLGFGNRSQPFEPNTRNISERAKVLVW